MKEVATWMAVILAFLCIMWGVQGSNFFMFKVFAPKYEQVRRDTFEQSKAYRQGLVQELQNMQFEYIKADFQHKTALAVIILHRAADYPIENLPINLQNFINDLRSERATIK